MSSPQSHPESEASDAETLTSGNSSAYGGRTITEFGSESSRTIMPGSDDRHQISKFSKLCKYCRIISGQLMSVREIQEAYDAEYYSTTHPDAKSFPSWRRPGRRYKTFDHYRRKADMKLSADKGCALCTRLLEGDEYGDPRQYADVSIDEITAVLTFGPSRDRDDQWEIMLRLAWDPGNVKLIYIKAISDSGPEHSSPSTNTQDGLELAKFWFDECRTQHSCCSPTDGANTILPTRLLDLTNDEVCLCLSKELDPHTNYATLSYCLGSGKFLMLKNKNLTEFMRRIPPEALPKTIQDAIDIARYLGLQYLWINSLCVIQDDSNDWEWESALMSNVYGSSTINIAASGAADVNQGCFFDRSETWCCLLKGDSTQSQTLVAYARWALWWRLVSMPLSKRGWGVQERVLSRRTIFFTQKELFWECDELGACESFPNNCPGELYEHDVAIGLKKRPMTLNTWDQFLRLYTSSNLTLSKDKLIAISGIARAVQKEIEDDYIAGLWRKDIEHQLLWKKLYSSEDGVRPAEYRAPSWTWAAIDGVVSLERFNTQPLMIRVSSINLQYLTPSNPFGAILSGAIRIDCDQFIRATIHRKSESIILVGQKEDLGPMVNIDFDAKNDGSAKTDEKYIDVWILPIAYVEPWRKDCLLLKIAGDKAKSEMEMGNMFRFHSLPFLNLWKGKGNEKEKEKEQKVKVEKKEEKQISTIRQYQRIGRVSISTSWHEMESETTLRTVSYAAKDKDYSEISVDEDGVKRYFVDII